MANIIRIRDLQLETILSGVTIPADKFEYTDNARRITIDDICTYCSSPPIPPGPYFTVTPSTRAIAYGGGNSDVFTVNFYNFVIPRNWWIVGLSARTWSTGTLGTYTLSRMTGTNVTNTFYGSCSSALGPLDLPRNSGPIAVYASGITSPQTVTITQPIPGYNYPSFTSFKFNGVTIYDVGVGDTVNSVTASWLNTFPSYIQTNSIYIDPAVGDGPLSGTISGLSPDSSTTLIFNSPTGLKHDVPYQTPTYRIVGTNTIGDTFDRYEPSIRWNYWFYWGTNPNEVINEAGILNLQNRRLIIGNNILGTYDFVIPNDEEFFYWAYPFSVCGKIDYLENLGWPGTAFSVCIDNFGPGLDYSANAYDSVLGPPTTLSYISVPMSSSGWVNYAIYRSDKLFSGAGSASTKINSVQ